MVKGYKGSRRPKDWWLRAREKCKVLGECERTDTSVNPLSIYIMTS